MKDVLEAIESWWWAVVALVSLIGWSLRTQMKGQSNAAAVRRLEKRMNAQDAHIEKLYDKQQQANGNIIEIKTTQKAMIDTMKEGFKSSKDERKELRDDLNDQFKQIIDLMKKK